MAGDMNLVPNSVYTRAREFNVLYTIEKFYIQYTSIYI